VAWVIPLDSGLVIALCTTSRVDHEGCERWLVDIVSKGATMVIPDVVDYEVRRGHLLASASSQMARLDLLRKRFNKSAEVTPAAWAKAAEFWAHVRRIGLPTTHLKSLGADAVLAAVAATIGRRSAKVTIATTNVGHLDRFPRSTLASGGTSPDDDRPELMVARHCARRKSITRVKNSVPISFFHE
jgi:predicted nucleic acid-binding protein